MEENKLTQEQFEQVAKTLQENQPPEIAILQESQEEAVINQETPKEFYANVTVDNETGLTSIKPIEENKSPSIKEVLEGDGELVDTIRMDEQTEKDIESFFNIKNVNEVKDIMNVLQRFRKGEKVKYNDLPPSLKSMASMMAAQTNNKQEATNDLLKFALNNLALDQGTLDFNEMLQKEMEQVPDMFEMYGDSLKEKFEVEYRQKAEEQDNPEIKEKLLKVSDEFTESYNFKRLFDFVDNNHSFVRKLKKEIKRIDRWITSMNYKYMYNNYNQHNIKLIIMPILRAFRDNQSVTEDDAKKILVLICKVCQNMNPDIVWEHCYMYYIIEHFLSLDHMREDKDTFLLEFKDNILKLIDKIHEIENLPVNK